MHSIEFAAHVARAELARRGIEPKALDYGALGITVPQQRCFYGLPWLAGSIGAGHIGGPTLMQACATGVRTLLAAAQEIEIGMVGTALRKHSLSIGPSKTPGAVSRSDRSALRKVSARQ